MDTLVLSVVIFLLSASFGETVVNNCSGITLPFKCADGKQCIRRSDFCDNEHNCTDGSDEIIYNASIHQTGFKCEYRRKNPNGKECFLPEMYKCDHDIDCMGGQDECNCSSTFQCANGDCALRVTFCDGRPHCRDGSDEKPYNRTAGGFQCKVRKKHVTSSCSLPDVHVCDGASDCRWGTDECFCDNSSGGRTGQATNAFSSSKCFRCLDGTLVIPNQYVCDGNVHCQDMSDECLCSEREMDEKNTSALCKDVCVGKSCKCRGKLECKPRVQIGESEETICVEPESICDEKFDCENGHDEKFCALDEEFFHCTDGSKRVRKNVICDGVADCPDKSDEYRCHEEKFLCQLYTLEKMNWTHLQGWNNTESYPPLNRTSVEEDWSNKGKERWTFYYPYYATPCDGIPLCTQGEDECDKENYTSPNCTTPPPKFCDFMKKELKCNNSDSKITGYEVCDGQPTCNDTAPHTSIDEMGCPNRFYCKNRGSTRLPIHIPAENECDGVAECDDESDELACSEETHFYCNGSASPRFIPVALKCDKRKDCSEGEDECADCSAGDPFSSDDRLIRSRVLVGFLWIIGTTSTLGNIAIIIHQITNIYKISNGKNQVALKNRILVLNLSCADLLMGIYLIALGIKDATVDKYCLHDQEWRNSSTCSWLGVTAIVGTEASVLILIIMTSHRLHLVFRPFKTPTMTPIIVSVIAAWIIAIILAIVPLLSSTREYFLSCVWFRNHRYLGYACREAVTSFTQKLVALEGPSKAFSSVVGSEYTWKSMLEAQMVLNESYVPERYYGYYSAHSVCLTRFFPDVENDTSWKYSLFIVLLNFFGFLYILVSYIFIYKQTTSNQISKKHEDRAAALQRKVTRIVLTDFCCWMPICIMAFITVGGIDVGPLAYAVTAIILLPINSAMNPFLYSSLLDMIWNKVTRASVSGSTLGRSITESIRRRHGKRSRGSLATSVSNMPATVYVVESSGDGSSTPKQIFHVETNDIELKTISKEQCDADRL